MHKGITGNETLNEPGQDKERYKAHYNFYPFQHALFKRCKPGVGTREEKTVAHYHACRTGHYNYRKLNGTVQHNYRKGLPGQFLFKEERIDGANHHSV